MGEMEVPGGEAAVTSSVSSRMPLKEDRKVLSTPKPWNSAAAPCSGGGSRRSQALNISVRPTDPPTPDHQKPRKGTRNLVDRKADRNKQALGKTEREAGACCGALEEACREGRLHTAAQSGCKVPRRHWEG